MTKNLKRLNADAAPQQYQEDKVLITYNESLDKYTVFLTDLITEPYEYNNVFDLFSNARDGSQIDVVLNGPGGNKETMDLIRGLAVRTEARTKAIIGSCASAHTVLALSFDEIEVLENIEFMIHNYSGGAWGKHHELISQLEFHKNYMPDMFREYYKDFLTPEEIEDVIKGNDIYLSSTDVRDRWEKVIEARTRAQQEYVEAYQQHNEQSLVETLKEMGYRVTKPKVKNESTTVK